MKWSSVVYAVVLFASALLSCSWNGEKPLTAPKSHPIEIAKLDPKLDRQEVTVQVAVSSLEGVAQLSIEGQAPTFIIQATSDHPKKDLSVWIEGELANVLDRLQLSYGSSNPIKKGTVIVATGTLSFAPGTGTRQGHEWYSLNVAKWQNFRIVAPTLGK